MSSISKNISLTFGSKILGTLLALGSSIFLARLLGKEGNGVYGFLIANVNLFVVILGFGMSQTMTYFMAKDDADSDSVSAFGFYITLVATILFSIFVFALFYFKLSIIGFLVPKGYVSLFIIFFLIGNFIHKSTINYFIGIWQGTLKFLDMNIALILGNGIRLIVLAGLWLYVENVNIDISIGEVLYVVLGILVVDLLIRLVIFIKGKNKINFNISKSKALGKGVLVFGSIGIATRVFNFANKRIDIWFVEAYEGLEELGVYVLATGLVEIIIATIVPGIQVLIPYFTQSTSPQRIKLLCTVSRINILFTTILIFFTVLLSIFIIPFLYGEDFSDSVLPFILLCLGAYFLLIRNVFAAYNVSINKQSINVRANIISLIVTLVFLFFLIPKYGIIGACISSIAAYFTSCIFVIIKFLNTEILKLSDLFLFNKSDYYLTKNFISKGWSRFKK